MIHLQGCQAVAANAALHCNALNGKFPFISLRSQLKCTFVSHTHFVRMRTRIVCMYIRYGRMQHLTTQMHPHVGRQGNSGRSFTCVFHSLPLNAFSLGPLHLSPLANRCTFYLKRLYFSISLFFRSEHSQTRAGKASITSGRWLLSMNSDRIGVGI